MRDKPPGKPREVTTPMRRGRPQGRLLPRASFAVIREEPRIRRTRGPGMTTDAQSSAQGLPMFQAKMLIRPAIAWLTVALFLIFGSDWMAHLDRHEIGLALFAWLFFVIVWVSFGVVHEAEELAGLLGEPVGTLVLTLSIVIIEVVLISAVMLGAGDTATLARDTMFAVLMIVLNGVVGIGLLIGGLRHHEQ